MAGRNPDVRGIVQRVFVRQDVLDACKRRDLGTIIEVLGAHGLAQGRLAGLVDIPQGRLSNYVHGKHKPTLSTFQKFADGLDLPPAARQALGLAPRSAAPETSFLVVGHRPGEIGFDFPDTPSDAAENVNLLWRADLGDADLVDRSRIDLGAWDGASMRWLIDQGRELPRAPAAGARIGMPDVARFRATMEMFVQLDDRFGGGHARQALIQYLSTDGERLLCGRYTDAVGRALFSAVAEATLLGAWMSYDSAPKSGLAQRYFVQALALAQAGDDRLLGASVLDAMSHQATYLGRFGEAANLARAARTGTRGLATATLSSHFHTMEARALARLGDAKASDHALAQAVREFERRKPEDDPHWMQYFNESELSAEFGHCFRDLGRPRDATKHASRSLEAIGDTTLYVAISSPL
jgi:transcriptional regulator with XRE-family HTH domain